MAKEKSLQKECERLRERVAHLERQQERDRRTLAALRKSRNTLRKALSAFFKDEYSDDPEYWEREMKTALPLSAFIGELEEIVAKKKAQATRQRKPA